MLVFEESGKPEYPGKNLSEQSTEPTNSTHIWRRIQVSIPGHIGGRRVLSPQRQPCSATSVIRPCFHPHFIPVIIQLNNVMFPQNPHAFTRANKVRKKQVSLNGEIIQWPESISRKALPFFDNQSTVKGQIF